MMLKHSASLLGSRHVGRAFLSSRFLLHHPRATAVPSLGQGGVSFSSTTTSTVEDQDWTKEFLQATKDIHHEVPFQESANMLRQLTQTDLLKPKDIIDNPKRFFEAHRILARHATAHGPGFWVRFTVHYNLFAGTVLAVGNDEQANLLEDYQRDGLLGCFALTEKLAGVQSGLVVQTTAEWNEREQKFVLNTPNVGARKNWISQGFTADKSVVIADLTVAGKKVGPHAFLMDFRHGDGTLVNGIDVDDMGIKTAGNDLDNAWIHFSNVELDKSALLSKYASINENDQYELLYEGLRPFDMIGQRLYTGRICVAQAGLEYRRQLFKQTKEYSDHKSIFSFGGTRVLSNIPQLDAIYEENQIKQKELDTFVFGCERSLSECLQREVPPSTELVEAIATCKVKAIEDSIDMCFRLKQEVGSFALMGASGFGNMDFLQACKFAEGDSRILMQKMARDRLKQFGAAVSGKGNVPITEFTEKEQQLCAKLGGTMKQATDSGMDKQMAWDQEWITVYQLAEAVMERIMNKGVENIRTTDLDDAKSA